MLNLFKNTYIRIVALVFCGVVIAYGVVHFSHAGVIEYSSGGSEVKSESIVAPVTVTPLDKAAYDAKLLQLANIPPVVTSSKSTATSPSKPVPAPLWPVKTVYPLPGALLPFNRIVAYYGNFYSKGMGILGEYPPDEVLQKLKSAVEEWKTADPTTPVMPAIDYIAVTAQGSAGSDGKYRARMPANQIQKAIDLAKQVDGIVILEVQVGKSTVQTEIPLLETYLKLPQVELALDPEFSMKTDRKPGSIIGTMDATDINYAANYLATLVKDNNLPPKIIIVHRFTQSMVTNYKKITPLPEVQIVMDMDGWGVPEKKVNIYTAIVGHQPVQFTGLKLFYKNDLALPTKKLLTPAQVLKLQPQPSFIQYQ